MLGGYFAWLASVFDGCSQLGSEPVLAPPGGKSQIPPLHFRPHHKTFFQYSLREFFNTSSTTSTSGFVWCQRGISSEVRCGFGCKINISDALI